ncbi:MAG: heparinase II/III family protein [Rhodoglobus sp.]|nr:heparinase II/III family protein [Rhodoglobus sp.]
MAHHDHGIAPSSTGRGLSRRTLLKTTAAVGGFALAGSFGTSGASALGRVDRTSLYPGPSLFFAASDRPALQALVSTPSVSPAWNALVAQAEQFIDPSSTAYANPTLINTWPGNRNLFSRWIEALGFIYQVTGDTRFSDHGRTLLLEAVPKLELGGPILNGTRAAGNESGPVAAIFAMGHDWLAETMSAAERATVEDAMESHTANVLDAALTPNIWWRPFHNYMGYVVGGGGMAALRLHHAGLAGAEAWVDTCADIVGEWFDHGFDAQGAGVEGTYYALFGLTNAMRFIDALGADGLALLSHPSMLSLPHFFAQVKLPGLAQFDARNDATYTSLRSDTAIAPVMLRLIRANGTALGRWLQDEMWPVGNSVFEVLWHENATATSPEAAGEPLAEHFEGRGLCVFRTGWQNTAARRDVMFSIEAGLFQPTTHSQADKGHFALYGYGRKWALDSGYGNNITPTGRSQTIAHNCVLVDGRGQARSGAGLGTDGHVLLYEATAEYGYVATDCAPAYRTNIQDPRGVYNPARADGMPMQQAYRQALFVRPSGNAPVTTSSQHVPYAIIVDDIQQDAEEHEYVWQMLTAPEMSIAITGENAEFTTPSGAEAMTVFMSATDMTALTTSSYTANAVPGSPATVPVLRATSLVVNPRFVSVLVPRPAAIAPPEIATTIDATGVSVTVSWPDRTDSIRIDRVSGAVAPTPVVTLEPVVYASEVSESFTRTDLTWDWNREVKISRGDVTVTKPAGGHNALLVSLGSLTDVTVEALSNGSWSTVDPAQPINGSYGSDVQELRIQGWTPGRR